MLLMALLKRYHDNLGELPGPQGKPGPPGINGTTGEKGAPGMNGADGADGLTPIVTVADPVLTIAYEGTTP